MTRNPSNCPRCSAPLQASDEVCPFCGYLLNAALSWDEAPSPPPPPLTPPPPVAATPSAAAPTADVATIATTPPAWETWRKFGFFTALWLTWRESVFRPVVFFRRLPPRDGYGSPLGYTVLVTVVGLFFNFYWGVVEGAVSGTLEGGLLLELAGGLVTLIFALAFVIPLYVGLLFASVAIIHVGFLLVGAGRRGFEATFRAVAYASSPAAFAIFPFFGPLLSIVWGMVLIFIGLREVQRTTNGRASLGFLIPLLAAIMLAIVLGAVLALLLGSLELESPA